MNVKRYKKMCALLLAGAMTAGMTVPAKMLSYSRKRLLMSR